MGNFNEHMARANAVGLSEMGNGGVTVNGVAVRASIDDNSSSPFFKMGGVSTGTNVVAIIDKEDFLAANGKKGSTIAWGTRTSTIQSVSDDDDGVVICSCEPFKFRIA